MHCNESCVFALTPVDFYVGDVALGGRKLNKEEGLFNDKRKPSGFGTKQIFVSSSIRYSGRNTYAKPKR